MYVSASVQDVMVQDLRACAEHALVLIPNAGANYCSLDLAFTTYVDPRKATPSLVVQLQVCVWGGMGGCGGGVRGGDEGGLWVGVRNRQGRGAGHGAAGVPGALQCSLHSCGNGCWCESRQCVPRRSQCAAAAGPANCVACAISPPARCSCLPHFSHTCALPCAPLPQNPRVLLLMRFVADIMSAVQIITTTKDRTAKEAKPAAAAEQQQGGGGSSGPAGAASPAASKPGGEPGGRMEVVVQLQNVGLVVPTSTKSRSALGGQVDHLMIAVPGGLWQWGQWAQCAKKGCACGLVVAGGRCRGSVRLFGPASSGSQRCVTHSLGGRHSTTLCAAVCSTAVLSLHPIYTVQFTSSTAFLAPAGAH